MMTDKQIVEDFLQFLYTHRGYITTDTDNTYNYLQLRTAIINCLHQAMEDGYAKCLDEALTQAEMDFNKALISTKNK